MKALGNPHPVIGSSYVYWIHSPGTVDLRVEEEKSLNPKSYISIFWKSLRIFLGSPNALANFPFKGILLIREVGTLGNFPLLLFS